MSDTKVCEVCGHNFQRGPESAATWWHRKYCGAACKKEGNRVKRKARDERWRLKQRPPDSPTVEYNRRQVQAYLARAKQAADKQKARQHLIRQGVYV